MSQIIIIAKGTGGDIFPFLTIGRALQARGNIVTLFTHCVYENLVQEAGLAFIPLDDLAEYNQIQSRDTMAKCQVWQCILFVLIHRPLSAHHGTCPS